jgi:hypothetical protein
MRSLCRGRCRDFRFRSLRSRASLAAGCLRALRCRTPPGPGPGRAVGPAGRLRCDARVGVAPPNSLRSPSVHCARTTAASQSTKRAARADPAAALLAALKGPGPGGVRQRGFWRASHSVCLSQLMRLPCPCRSTVSAKNPFGLSLSKPCWRDKALTRKQGFAALWLVLTSCSSTAVGLPDPSSSPETHP